MVSKLTVAALIFEAGAILKAGYVFYRWEGARHCCGIFTGFAPYSGPFDRVVAPWIVLALFVPLAGLFVYVARRMDRS